MKRVLTGPWITPVEPRLDGQAESTPTASTDALYDAQDRLLSWGSLTYTHNAIGQRTSSTSPARTDTLNYDVFGTLESFATVQSATTTNLTYRNDPAGRRVQRLLEAPSAQPVTTRWLYADSLNPIAELRSDGGPFALRQQYVYGVMPNVPDVVVEGAGVSQYKVVSDHLGSVRLVVKAVGSGLCDVVQRIDYDPFGVVLADSTPGWQPFGFAGGLYEPVSGLVRFGARDYDAEVGRWTSKDPVRFEGGVNLYLYAEGEPVGLVDLTGLAPGDVYASVRGAVKLRSTRSP